MKKWNNPQIWQLGIESTKGKGNEVYTDPSKQPADHLNWTWCNTHNRWHPMDHS